MNRLIDEYPIRSFSWTMYSESIAVKRMDKSCFLHRRTSIPIDFKSYFDVTNLVKGEARRIYLVFKGITYVSRIELDNQNRTRLFWDNKLSEIIHNRLPEWAKISLEGSLEKNNAPDLRFVKSKIEKNTYGVDLINQNTISLNSEILSSIENGTHDEIKEDKRTYTNSKVYERDFYLRREAIRIHGIKCTICGFDFENTYGKHGIGFIEIHHIIPHCTSISIIDVNPITDLVPLCSNCHSMIHRNRNSILSIVQLKTMLKQEK